MALTYRVVCLQILSILVIAALLLWGVGLPTAAGALWTGLACVGPNLLFAWRVERTRSATQAPSLLRGTVVRFVTTAGLLVAVIAALQPPPLGFVAGLVTAQLAQVAGALLLR